MCGIQDKIFDMTENALAGFYIPMGMIVEREKMMMQKREIIVKAALCLAKVKIKKRKRVMKGLKC